MNISPEVKAWFDGLSNHRYLYNEEQIAEQVAAQTDFLGMLQLRKELSGSLLENTLKRRSRVVMFGAGGTASWFLPKLLKIYNDAFTKRPDLAYELEILILDGDTVEDKNIIRQNFINDDIGQHKASVLAERYTGLYPHISVNAIPLYATSASYDAKIIKIDPLDPEFFYDIDSTINHTDIIVNLVDNESFKRKLDDVIFRRSPLLYFNAGINLYNGQCYVSYPRLSNVYTIDHPSFIDDVEEVQVHSCADADAEGSASNPEQMFNGNDLAASILANLYQTALTEVLTHRKIKFVCGNNISIERALPTTAPIFYAVAMPAFDVEFPYEEAQAYVTRYGKNQKSEKARKYYETISIVDQYQILEKIHAEAVIPNS